MSFASYLRLDRATGTSPTTKVPVTANLLTTGVADSSGTSKATASISPGAGKLVLIAIMNVGGAAADPNSVSGAGLTFTKLLSGSLEATWSGASLWYACSASPTTGPITIGFAASHDGVYWHVAEFDCDAHPSVNGRNAILQAATSHFTGASQATTVFTGNSSAFLHNSNATILIGVQNNASSATSTPGSGMTELSDANAGLSADGRQFHISINWANSQVQQPEYTNSTGAGTQFAGAFFLELKAKAAATGYSLTANGGSVALAGQSVSLKFGHKVGVSSGAFAVAGQSANLKYGRKVVSQSGAFNFAGQTASLIYTAPAIIVAQSGSVSISGTSANLKRALRLSASAGAIIVSGQSVTLRRSLKLTAQSGSTAVSGQTTAMLVGRKLGSATGTVAVTGQSVAEKVAHRLSASAGSTAVAGQTAGLSKITSGYVLVASTGSVAVAGQNVGLIARRLENAQSTSVGVSGSSATLKRSRVVQAITAGTSVAGSSASLLRSRRIAASAGSRSVSGQSAQLSMAHRLSANTGGALIAGQIARLLNGKRLALVTRAFDVTGFNAELGRIRHLQAGSGAFDINGQVATLLCGKVLVGSVGDMLVIGNDASLTRQSETDFARSQAISIIARMQDIGLVVPFSTTVSITGALGPAATTGIDGRSVSIAATVRNLGNG